MSDHSSLLVERLWKLKRSIDKGHCQGIDFVHLNALLREPAYRADVLRRVEAKGTPELQALARDIMANDTGQSFVAKTPHERLARNNQNTPGNRHRTRRHRLMLVPVLGAFFAAVAGFTAFENRAVRVTQDIVSDTVWETGRRYILEDLIYVENAHLTIQPGTIIEGQRGSALVVTRDSQLLSRGTREQPVIFTSHRPEGKRQRGDWGGIVLLGKAPVNEMDARIEGIPEDDLRGRFGGSDREHSCGVLQYTRIEFAGFEVYRNNELNGLTLGGCGSNTLVDHVQVHRALDDGIEMFGGTVNLKHILITGAADDSIDWDWGWKGKVQFAVIQQYGDVGDNGFEGDSNGSNHNAVPRSEPTFYNVTMHGSGRAAKQHRAILLREGSGGHFHNMIIDSYAIEALDTRDEVASLVSMGKLGFSHNLLANTGGLAKGPGSEESEDDDYGFREGEWLHQAGQQQSTLMESALHSSASHETSPHFRARGLVRNKPATRPPQSEFFDESADYLGAINPRTSRTWIEGWTAFPDA
jgi:hypothetical protein